MRLNKVVAYTGLARSLQGRENTVQEPNGQALSARFFVIGRKTRSRRRGNYGEAGQEQLYRPGVRRGNFR